MARDNVKARGRAGRDPHVGLRQPAGCSARGRWRPPRLSLGSSGSPNLLPPTTRAHQELRGAGETGGEEALGSRQRTERAAEMGKAGRLRFEQPLRALGKATEAPALLFVSSPRAHVRSVSVPGAPRRRQTPRWLALRGAAGAAAMPRVPIAPRGAVPARPRGDAAALAGSRGAGKREGWVRARLGSAQNRRHVSCTLKSSGCGGALRPAGSRTHGCSPGPTPGAAPSVSMAGGGCVCHFRSSVPLIRSHPRALISSPMPDPGAARRLGTERRFIGSIASSRGKDLPASGQAGLRIPGLNLKGSKSSSINPLCVPAGTGEQAGVALTTEATSVAAGDIRAQGVPTKPPLQGHFGGSVRVPPPAQTHLTN